MLGTKVWRERGVPRCSWRLDLELGTVETYSDSNVHNWCSITRMQSTARWKVSVHNDR